MREEIQKIIEEINLRVTKDYKKMTILELSGELRDAMEFERKIFSKIEELEIMGEQKDVVHYVKIVCKNTTGREITAIQDAYLEKIENEYLS